MLRPGLFFVQHHASAPAAAHLQIPADHVAAAARSQSLVEPADVVRVVFCYPFHTAPPLSAVVCAAAGSRIPFLSVIFLSNSINRYMKLQRRAAQWAALGKTENLSAG